jgi:hypothetical protein
MALQNTNLLLQVAPLRAAFRGSPQEMVEEIIRRARIVSPSGTNFIYIGDTEPTSNVGPWLKNGDRWYVWDEDTKRYIPLNIDDSETTWFQVGPTTPATSNPGLWLRCTHAPTSTDTSLGQMIGWYAWDGAFWVPTVGIVLAGPTATRPTSPVTYQQYYDTDIAVLLWFERSAWRTVDGNIGDVKHVAWEFLQDALDHNPGWELLGASNQAWRGRLISQATKDPGLNPANDLSLDPGVASRAAHEVFGETDGVEMDASSTVPYPPTIALWTLVKT